MLKNRPRISREKYFTGASGNAEHWRLTWSPHGAGDDMLLLGFLHPDWSSLSIHSLHYPAFHPVAAPCAVFVAAFPALVFATLPPSASLPHAGFLFPLIFSSTSSLTRSALLGSTYNISLFLHPSLFNAAPWTSFLLLFFLAFLVLWSF